MSYNGSGTFQINTTGQPVVTGTVISSTAFNSLTSDLATGLSTAITKDGQTTTTVRIPFAAGINSSLATDSSSTTTGSIITAGGVGIVKNLYVGANTNIAGTLGVTGVATFVTPILGTPTSGSLVNCTGVQYTGFKNRIINGAMVIDQRNSGVSVSIQTTTGYTLDRWTTLVSQNSKFTVQQTPSATETGYATRVGVGFTNYLACTSASAYSLTAGDYFTLRQAIEGYNIADLAWGTANAKTVTLSFLVYSSLTGTFGGALQNNTSARSYPFSYTISSANTWTTISVTIAGDTSGTWQTGNLTGIFVYFGLGTGTTYSGTAGAWAGTNYTTATGATSVVGTSGATFYITGVQLEKGSTATSFDYRPYTTELQLCQRYYAKTFPQTVAPANNLGTNYFLGYSPNSANLSTIWKFPVTMRSAPTLTLFNDRVGGTAGQWTNGTIDGANGRALGSSTEFVMFDNTAVPVAASNWWLGGATAAIEL